MNEPTILRPFPLADAHAGLRHVFVRDLVVESLIGVYAHEKDGAQRIRINIDLSVAEGGADVADRLDAVVCYEEIVKGARRIAGEGHTNLVETLAERLARFCLEDRRIRTARVRIEKLDVFADVESVGVEIERFNSQAPIS